MELFLAVRHQLILELQQALSYDQIQVACSNALKCLFLLKASTMCERAIMLELFSSISLVLMCEMMTQSDPIDDGKQNLSKTAEEEIDSQYDLSESYLKQLHELIQNRSNKSVALFLHQHMKQEPLLIHIEHNTHIENGDNDHINKNKDNKDNKDNKEIHINHDTKDTKSEKGTSSIVKDGKFWSDVKHNLKSKTKDTTPTRARWFETFAFLSQWIQNYPQPIWIQKTQGVYYLNMKKRPERKMWMEHQLKQKVGIPDSKIVNVEGPEHKTYGAIGATQGHIKILEQILALNALLNAENPSKSHDPNDSKNTDTDTNTDITTNKPQKNKKNKYHYALVLEDDFEFQADMSVVHTKLDSIFEGKMYPGFGLPDVLNLCMNIQQSSPDPLIPICHRVEQGCDASAYFISIAFIPTLLKNFKEGLPLLEKTQQHWIYALDQYWMRLQGNKSRWYVMHPQLGAQRNFGYSDTGVNGATNTTINTPIDGATIGGTSTATANNSTILKNPKEYEQKEDSSFPCNEWVIFVASEWTPMLKHQWSVTRKQLKQSAWLILENDATFRDEKTGAIIKSEVALQDNILVLNEKDRKTKNQFDRGISGGSLDTSICLWWLHLKTSTLSPYSNIAIKKDLHKPPLPSFSHVWVIQPDKIRPWEGNWLKSIRSLPAQQRTADLLGCNVKPFSVQTNHWYWWDKLNIQTTQNAKFAKLLHGDGALNIEEKWMSFQGLYRLSLVFIRQMITNLGDVSAYGEYYLPTLCSLANKSKSLVSPIQPPENFDASLVSGLNSEQAISLQLLPQHWKSLEFQSGQDIKYGFFHISLEKSKAEDDMALIPQATVDTTTNQNSHNAPDIESMCALGSPFVPSTVPPKNEQSNISTIKALPETNMKENMKENMNDNSKGINSNDLQKTSDSLEETLMKELYTQPKSKFVSQLQPSNPEAWFYERWLALKTTLSSVLNLIDVRRKPKELPMFSVVETPTNFIQMYSYLTLDELPLVDWIENLKNETLDVLCLNSMESLNNPSQLASLIEQLAPDILILRYSSNTSTTNLSITSIQANLDKLLDRNRYMYIYRLNNDLQILQLLQSEKTNQTTTSSQTDSKEKESNEKCVNEKEKCVNDKCTHLIFICTSVAFENYINYGYLLASSK